jgi:trehalose-phosphatase
VHARVGPAVTFVAGLHGLEVEGPDAVFRHDVLRVVEPIVAAIVRTARRDLAWCRGVYLEDKTYSVTCHVRGVPAHAAGRALDEFEAIARPHVTAGVLRLLSASEALEVLPATDWHKGRAVDWIRAHETARTSEPVSVVYLGDDRTDEDAFAALGPDDAAIGVGRRPAESLIDWRLAGPESVGRFLSHLGRRRRQSAGP